MRKKEESAEDGKETRLEGCAEKGKWIVRRMTDRKMVRKKEDSAED